MGSGQNSFEFFRKNVVYYIKTIKKEKQKFQLAVLSPNVRGYHKSEGKNPKKNRQIALFYFEFWGRLAPAWFLVHAVVSMYFQLGLEAVNYL